MYTLNNDACFITCLINGLYTELPDTQKSFLNWINESYKDKVDYSIQKGLTKTLFKPVYNRAHRN